MKAAEALTTLALAAAIFATAPVWPMRLADMKKQHPGEAGYQLRAVLVA